MAAGRGPLLVLVYEPEAACLERLSAAGFEAARAAEVASYLAQSTDMLPELAPLADACGRRGIELLPVQLDQAATAMAGRDPGATLVWTLTDGIAYFRGGAAPALARLDGLATIGSDDSLFALCQDKFRSGAVLSAFGLPVPPAGLARDGAWLAEPPASPRGWFVKPNRLGAKIGIWEESRCSRLEDAAELSRRIYAAYRDDAIVQAYVPGRNVRASFLAVEPEAASEALGICFVDAGSDFQTMADSMALYGTTGAAALAAGAYAEPALQAVRDSRPQADDALRRIAWHTATRLGLADVFSMDFRVEADDTVHLLEFEVCPGLPCFDFRDYCRRQWAMPLPEAMAAAAASRFARGIRAVRS